MLQLRHGSRLKMHRNITIIRSILTPSDHHQFFMSFRTVTGTIKAVWTSGAKSSEKTIFLENAYFSCTFFCFANKEAQSIGLAISQLDLLFPVWGISLQRRHCSTRQSQGRVEERTEGKHLRTCRERQRELFV